MTCLASPVYLRLPMPFSTPIDGRLHATHEAILRCVVHVTDRSSSGVAGAQRHLLGLQRLHDGEAEVAPGVEDVALVGARRVEPSQLDARRKHDGRVLVVDEILEHPPQLGPLARGERRVRVHLRHRHAERLALVPNADDFQ